MNRGLVVIAGASILVALIAVILLVQEKNEKQVLSQENNHLKNYANNLAVESRKNLEVKPITPKQIAGFGRELA